MKHSEVLSRYVNTGTQIPEKQYDRLTPVLKKSYLRMRRVAGYDGWEFKFLTDDERIKSIEKKGKELLQNEINYLLYSSNDKDLIATKIIDVKGEKLNHYDIYHLVKRSKSVDNIAIKIIEVKGEYLDYNDIYVLLDESNNKDLIATKIIDVKGEKLWSHEIKILLQHTSENIEVKIIQTKEIKLSKIDINNLLTYSKDKELIKKLLLQNGVDYKLINDAITSYNIDTPLIPDNYQSMLQEIRRIKEIMI